VRRATSVRRVTSVPGVAIHAPLGPRYAEILSPDALTFLAQLHRRFDSRRCELIAAQAQGVAGDLSGFRPAGANDRRVDLAGLADRKTIIDALNSGAQAVIADFADAEGGPAPSWANILEGQINLKDYWAGTLSFTDPMTGKDHALSPDPAKLMLGLRGWHIDEERLTVDGRAVSGALFDLALCVFYNARAALGRGAGLQFCLAASATRDDARLWQEAFEDAEAALGLPPGTVKAAPVGPS
jgi:malate synthase